MSLFPNPYSAESHLLFESLGYLIGFQLYLKARRSSGPPITSMQALSIVAGAISGAMLGSKLLYIAEYPAYALADFPNWPQLLGGKTIVGGLLGGVIGVEVAKKLENITQSTGDSIVFALLVGMMLGRVGCFLAGLNDNTYGGTTSLPWAVDFGDGLPRHPTPLYEIAFLAALYAGLRALSTNGFRHFLLSGDLFRLFMLAYLLWRFGIDFIKPPHTEVTAWERTHSQAHLYFGWLTSLQLACITGWLYYFRDLKRIVSRAAPV